MTTIYAPLILSFAEFSELAESPFHLGKTPIIDYVENLMFENPYTLTLVQGTDIPVQKIYPLIHVHVHLTVVWLRLTHVTLSIECTTIRARAANKR